MNLGALRAILTSTLGRQDMTTPIANQYIAMAIQRIQRDLRLPSMERLVVYQNNGLNPDGVTPTPPLQAVQVPSDFIAMKELLVQCSATVTSGYPYAYDYTTVDGDIQPDAYVPLQAMSLRQLQTVSSVDAPRAYARYQSMFNIRGYVPNGLAIQMWYLGEFSPLALDTDENEILAASPDLVLYGSLSLAADQYNHPSGNAWEARYQAVATSVQQQAMDVELMGGPMVVQPAYLT